MYALETEKRELLAQLQITEALPHNAELFEQLLAQKQDLEKRERVLKEKEKLLRVAAAKARCEILKSARTEETATTIPAIHFSPGKTAHMDMATLQSMLREREKELAVLREDNAAKESELLLALSSLSDASQRESQLQRKTQDLSEQLNLAQEELKNQGDMEEDMEKAVAERREMEEAFVKLNEERVLKSDGRGGRRAAFGVAQGVVVVRLLVLGLGAVLGGHGIAGK